MGKNEKVTVGYKYYLGMHAVFCTEADSVEEIKAGEKTCWNTRISNNQTIYINKPDLFGGEKAEGGVQGKVDIMFGRPDQQKNAYLVSQLGEDIPAFRGVVSFVLNQVYVSAMNPYIKPWWAKFRRIPAQDWYSAKASINGHANPAHIIYHLVRKYNLGVIDDASFRSAADTLYSEGFGLSFYWKGTNVGEFIQEIVDHIGAMIFPSPTTGRIVLKLIRKDYNISNLPVFDEGNIVSLQSYERRTLSDTVNEVVITYEQDIDGEEVSVTYQDLANIQAQGKVVRYEVTYPGIPTDALANRVAARDLKAMSALLSKVKLRVNRKAFNLGIGDVFVLKWPKLGLDQVVYRIGEINYGTLTDSTITISALEDIYSLDSTVYTAPQNAYWQNPITAPTPAPVAGLYELPYWDVARTLDPANFSMLEEGDAFVGSLASRASGIMFNYDLLLNEGGGYDTVGTFVFTPSATLDADINETDITLSVTNMTDIGLATTDNTEYAWIGQEAVRVDNIDVAAGTIRVGRGCLDTVPQKHTAGEKIVFAVNYGYVETVYVSGQTIQGKVLPRTGQGVLDAALAPVLSVMLRNRLDRPYPPASLKIGGILYPEISVGDLELSWYHRDKTQQTATVIDQTVGNVGPETGTTYTVQVRRQDNNAVLYTGTGITTNIVTIPNIDIGYDGDIIIEAWSVLNGFESWQRQTRAFVYLRAPMLQTEETAETLTTETGEHLLLEG